MAKLTVLVGDIAPDDNNGFLITGSLLFTVAQQPSKCIYCFLHNNELYAVVGLNSAPHTQLIHKRWQPNMPWSVLAQRLSGNLVALKGPSGIVDPKGDIIQCLRQYFNT